MSFRVYKWVRDEDLVRAYPETDPNDPANGNYSPELAICACAGKAWEWLENHLRIFGPPRNGTRYCIYDGTIFWADDPVMGLNQLRSAEERNLADSMIEMLDAMEEEERNGRAAAHP